MGTISKKRCDACIYVKACLNDPTFQPTFQPTNFTNFGRGVQITQHFIQHFYRGYDLNTLWWSCAFETGNHDQNANSTGLFYGRAHAQCQQCWLRWSNDPKFHPTFENNGIVGYRHPTFLTRMKLHPTSESQCWVTQHGVQTSQHFTQHQFWVNVGWNVESFK